MSTFCDNLRRIPWWTFGLALLAMTVNILYFIFKHQVSVDGQACHEVGGKAIVVYVDDPFQRT